MNTDIKVTVLTVVGAVAWIFLFNNDRGAGDLTGEPTEINLQEIPQVSSSEDLDETGRYLLDMDIDRQLDTSEIDQTLEEK